MKPTNLFVFATVAVAAVGLAMLVCHGAPAPRPAWVLWEERRRVYASGTVEGGYPSPLDAFDGKTACTTEQRRRTTPAPPAPATFYVDYYTYLCLPDTVDPRTPVRG